MNSFLRCLNNFSPSFSPFQARTGRVLGMLILALGIFTSGYGQSPFWSDDFESSGSPSSGTRTPEVEARDGSHDFFGRLQRDAGQPAGESGTNPDFVLGSSVTLQQEFTNISGDRFWGGEDHDDDGVGDGNSELDITWTNINISGRTNIAFAGLFAANNGDNMESSDQLFVEYRIDGGSWIQGIRIARNGSGGGDDDWALDTNNDGIGDSPEITEAFQELTFNISGTGTTLEIRVRVSVDDGNEEWGIDNFRLIDECDTPELSSCSTPVSINFSGFGGTGFHSTPGVAQLCSHTWVVTGLSDGNGTIGGIHINGDFARGATTGGGVNTGGIYALTPSFGALWVQPIGSDMTPGNVYLMIKNTSGGTLSSVDVAYDILVRNDQNRSSSFNFAYATGPQGTIPGSFTSVGALNYTTPTTADGSPSIQTVPRSTTLNGLSWANNEVLYIRWNTNDVSGSGDRDEFGLDNISVSIAAATAPVIAKVPNSASVCAGTTLTVSVTTPGSGGSGTCQDEYRFSTDNGSNWSAWSASIPSFAAVAGTNLVEARRGCSVSGCTSSSTQVSWTVNPRPTAAPGNVSVCIGQSVMMNGNPSGGTLPYNSHAWVVINGGSTGLGTGDLTNNNNGTVLIDGAGATGAGNAILRYTVTDANGCTAQETGTAMVNASPSCNITSGPTSVCPNSTGHIYTATGGGTYEWDVDGNGAIDGGNTGSSVTVDAGATGTYTVTVTVTDNGCTSSCTQEVTVEDNTLPTITCPANITVNTPSNSCEATGVALGSPVVSDNCSTSVSNDATEPYALGNTTVTWMVSDGTNSTTCEQVVTVEPFVSPPGEYFDLGTCLSIPCPPGTYCPGGTTAGIPCPAGTSQGLPGQTSCVACPAGSFSSAIGATVCTDCPAGTSQGLPGQTSCVDCPPGSFSSTTGATVCTDCPAGTSQGLPGQTSCVDCPPGSFSSTTGATVCTDCPAGTSQGLPGQTSCVDCPPGSFSSATGATVCTNCPAGTFQSLSGQTSCVNCLPGSFSSTTGATVCTDCPAGTSQGLSGQMSCVDCPPGSFSSTTGATVCTNCPAGTSQALSGQTNCVACLPGYFSASVGAIACTACEAGKYSDVPGSVICTTCPYGTTSTVAASSCTPLDPQHITVFGNGNQIANRAATVSVSDDTDFGAVSVGNMVTRTFTIYNIVNAVPLKLSGNPSVEIADRDASDFAVTAQPSTPVAGGGSTTFTVKFQPTATGLRTAIVMIASDDYPENAFVFTIQGTGL